MAAYQNLQGVFNGCNNGSSGTRFDSNRNCDYDNRRLKLGHLFLDKVHSKVVKKELTYN